ncbi:uncharacterized protein LOC127880641 isoform X2 [Dreissena polymorpha]|uniref:uncharacterized protein LOC127880641 isoform X2 n=1 Tax=Dreissena polymorpha TaxID=45954 RepID=UPI002264CDAA|nr:uncharacterized protein LOC127880641 isoform X2 [Dreissena polymorpha]
MLFVWEQCGREVKIQSGISKHKATHAREEKYICCGKPFLIEDRISFILAQRVEKQFLKPERKKALLQLLGQDFVNKYLPTARRNPWVLGMPQMTLEEKSKMLRDAQAYLNSQIYKATNEVGYEHMTNPNHQGNLAPEYSVFLQHTYAVFKTGLDRELYRQERELTQMSTKRQ